jgi:sarcosine oxidase subunit alpha
VTPLWRVGGPNRKAFVDFQNDVTAFDIALAARRISAPWRFKRYATLGMATDQGKTSNVNGLAIMAEITGRSIPETGTTAPARRGTAVEHLPATTAERFSTPTAHTSHSWAQEQARVENAPRCARIFPARGCVTGWRR